MLPASWMTETSDIETKELLILSDKKLLLSYFTALKVGLCAHLCHISCEPQTLVYLHSLAQQPTAHSSTINLHLSMKNTNLRACSTCSASHRRAMTLHRSLSTTLKPVSFLLEVFFWHLGNKITLKCPKGPPEPSLHVFLGGVSGFPETSDRPLSFALLSLNTFFLLGKLLILPYQ